MAEGGCPQLPRMDMERWHDKEKESKGRFGYPAGKEGILEKRL